MLRKKNSTEIQDFYGTQDEPSKFQFQKKEHRRMKKVRRINNRRGPVHENNIGEPAIVEETGTGGKKNSGEADFMDKATLI